MALSGRTDSWPHHARVPGPWQAAARTRQQFSLWQLQVVSKSIATTGSDTFEGDKRHVAAIMHGVTLQSEMDLVGPVLSREIYAYEEQELSLSTNGRVAVGPP